MTATPDPSFITTPPRDIDGWAAELSRHDLPVLEATALAIDELRGNEDTVDAQMVAGAVIDDPLMTLKLLRHMTSRRSKRMDTDAETVTSALVLLGIPPFFNAFQTLPTVEHRLAQHPDAQEGLNAVLRRAHRAARFALGFAVHRMDHDAEVIHEAALLHDFSEMLLWVHAPALAFEVMRRTLAEPTRRSAGIQHSVLNVRLSDLQQTLMRAWRLPELLVRISDDQVNPSPQVRNVQLAMRVARHSTSGWDNPALPDDLAELCVLLNLGLPHVQQLLLELDA